MVKHDITRRQYLGASAVSSVGVAGLSGCLGTIGGGEGLTWGLVAPFSGPYVSDGEKIRQGAELAIKQHNEDGGIEGENIEIHTEDSETDPAAATSAAERLYREQSIDVVSATSDGSVGLAISDFATRNEILAMTGVSTAEITSSDCGPYTYNIVSGVETMGNAALPWVDENGEHDSVFFVNADFAWGETAWDAYQGILNDLSIEAVGDTYVPLGESDYATYIQQVRESDADLVALTLWGEDLVQCVNQMMDVGLNEEMDIMLMYANLSFAQSIADVENLYAAGPYYWDIENETSREFVSMFEDEYDEKPTIMSGGEYNATNEILNVASEIGSTNPDDIAEALEGHEFTDFKGGDVQFRACDHVLTTDWKILQGKAESERESEADLFDILANRPSDEITAECSDECGLPEWQ